MTIEQLGQLEISQDKIRHHYLCLLDLAKRTRAKNIKYSLSKEEAWKIATETANKEAKCVE